MELMIIAATAAVIAAVIDWNTEEEDNYQQERERWKNKRKFRKMYE